MSTKCIKVDPSGDTLVILPKKGSSAGSTESDSPGSLGSQPALQFLCSKKHLTLASRRADMMFTSGFKEAVKDETDGLYHWKFEAIFSPEAFEIVMKIIHGRNREIPREVNLALLAGIAAVVDDLECHDALWFFAKGWLGLMRHTDPPKNDIHLAQRILISFVFDDPILFQASTKTAIETSWTFLPMTDLPIRPIILEHITQRWQTVLAQLVDGLYDIERQLLDQKLGCSPGCRAMFLGTLIQMMKECRLYSPRPAKPFTFFRLKSTIESLRKFQLPKYYSSIEDSPLCKHTGHWNMSPYSSSGGFYPSSGGFSHDQQGIPRTLVRHNCSLKDLIDPLLQGVEAEVKGLMLAQYSHC